MGRRQVFATTTPREPERPRFRPAPRSPFGQTVDMYLTWEKRMKETLLSVMEENRAALLACTGDSSCQQSVHRPGCEATL